jgi:hypothetical protein
MTRPQIRSVASLWCTVIALLALACNGERRPSTKPSPDASAGPVDMPPSLGRASMQDWFNRFDEGGTQDLNGDDVNDFYQEMSVTGTVFRFVAGQIELPARGEMVSWSSSFSGANGGNFGSGVGLFSESTQLSIGRNASRSEDGELVQTFSATADLDGDGDRETGIGAELMSGGGSAVFVEKLVGEFPLVGFEGVSFAQARDLVEPNSSECEESRQRKALSALAKADADLYACLGSIESFMAFEYAHMRHEHPVRFGCTVEAVIMTSNGPACATSRPIVGSRNTTIEYPGELGIDLASSLFDANTSCGSSNLDLVVEHELLHYLFGADERAVARCAEYCNKKSREPNDCLACLPFNIATSESVCCSGCKRGCFACNGELYCGESGKYCARCGDREELLAVRSKCPVRYKCPQGSCAPKYFSDQAECLRTCKISQQCFSTDTVCEAGEW